MCSIKEVKGAGAMLDRWGNNVRRPDMVLSTRPDILVM